MKYTREDISNFAYKDYILAMENELNAKGLMHEGKAYKVSTNVNGDFVSDFSRAFVLSIIDADAIKYLIEIGLINNGRCPLTGLMISNSSKTTYTSEYNGNITYEINRLWFDYNKTKRNWGCFLGIFVILCSIIVLFYEGFGNSFFYTLGVGIAFVVIFSIYGGAKFGNNWNVVCLSNQLGVNTISLYEIMKTEEKEGLSSNSINNHNLSVGDIELYQKWSYSSNLNIK